MEAKHISEKPNGCHFLDTFLMLLDNDKRDRKTVLEEFEEFAERHLRVLIELQRAEMYAVYLGKFKKFGFKLDSLPDNINNQNR